MSLIDNTRYRYTWYIRPVLALLKRQTGEVSEPVRCWARQPLALIGFLLMTRALDKDRPPVSRALRNVVRLRVAQLNSCHFCIGLNRRNALAQGVGTAKLDQLADFAESALFTDAEKIALAYAEAVTLAIPVSDTLTMQMRQTFGDDGVVALTAVIAHQNMSAKFNAALGVLPTHCGLTR